MTSAQKKEEEETEGEEEEGINLLGDLLGRELGGESRHNDKEAGFCFYFRSQHNYNDV